MDYLQINNQNLPYPKSFTMQKVPNVVAEITTMTGQTYADINGWKYADTTIEWGSLYPEDLQRLVSAVSSPSFNIQFINENGQTTTVRAILRGFNKSKTLARYGNKYVWEGVGITLSFPDCYQF